MNEIIANLKHAARNNGALIGGGEFSRAECRQAAAALTHAADLLACLIDAVRALEFAAPIIEAPENSAYRETIAQARAAIAKATGGAK